MAKEMIDLDLDGKVVAVPREVVSGLAAAAAARAGVSAQHRELSLLLGRALESGAATLDQAGVRTLCAVIEEEQDGRYGSAAAALLREAAA